MSVFCADSGDSLVEPTDHPPASIKKQNGGIHASALHTTFGLALPSLSAILFSAGLAAPVEARSESQAPQPDVTFTFTAIDALGAANTGAAGITGLDHIAGNYNQST